MPGYNPNGDDSFTCPTGRGDGTGSERGKVWQERVSYPSGKAVGGRAGAVPLRTIIRCCRAAPALPTGFSDLVPALLMIRPRSAGDLVGAIEALVGRYGAKKIDRRNTRSVCFAVPGTEPPIFVKTQFGPENAVHREARWYHTVHDWHPAVDHFMAAVRTETHATILLHYAPGPTIDELALAGDISATGAAAIFTEALSVGDQLSARHATRSIDVTEDVYLRRYEQRRRQATNVAHLSRLWGANGHPVNGTWLPSPWRFVERIVDDPTLYAYLTPTRYGLRHGDLHGGNLLLTSEGLRLVDPNGTWWLPDSYDPGKVLRSVHGGYPSIMAGRFRLIHDERHGFEFDVSEPTAYRDASGLLRDGLADDAYARALYAEAMHFTAMLPHHAAQSTETTALYLRACQVFDELFRMLSTTSPVR